VRVGKDIKSQEEKAGGVGSNKEAGERRSMAGGKRTKPKVDGGEKVGEGKRNLCRISKKRKCWTGSYKQKKKKKKKKK